MNKYALHVILSSNLITAFSLASMGGEIHQKGIKWFQVPKRVFPQRAISTPNRRRSVEKRKNTSTYVEKSTVPAGHFNC